MATANAIKAEKNRQEDVCAAVAASVLGARFRRHDHNSGNKAYDFNLEFEDGAVEALEVCSFTDETVKAQWKALDRIDVAASCLANSWTVAVVRSVKVKGLPSRAEPHLAVLETHRRTRFIAGDHFAMEAAGEPLDVVAASHALGRLGILDALQAPTLPGEPARIIVAAGTGGAGTSALVNRAVGSVAFERGNRLKLQSAREARRRHIFVPISPTAGPVWSIAREPPASPPRLPSGVDVAWIVAANGATLVVEPPNAWRQVIVDPVVWDDPDAWRA